MRALVTGSSGVVGRVAVDHLVKAGHEVVPFDVDIGADIRSDADVRNAVDDADGVVHLPLNDDHPCYPNTPYAQSWSPFWEYGAFLDVRDLATDWAPIHSWRPGHDTTPDSTIRP